VCETPTHSQSQWLTDSVSDSVTSVVSDCVNDWVDCQRHSLSVSLWVWLWVWVCVVNFRLLQLLLCSVSVYVWVEWPSLWVWLRLTQSLRLSDSLLIHYLTQSTGNGSVSQSYSVVESESLSGRECVTVCVRARLCVCACRGIHSVTVSVTVLHHCNCSVSQWRGSKTYHLILITS